MTMNRPMTMENNDNTQLDLAAITRRIELQHKQLEVEARFRKNILLFKELVPAIYEEYIDYQPKQLRLCLDEQGEVQLINFQSNNEPVYSGSPKAFAREQVKRYMASPVATSVNFRKHEIRNNKHLFLQLHNELLTEYEKIEGTVEPGLDVPIGTMLVTGCGLGYHLEELSERLDIYNLCIFDPHKDSFYACLHSIDWEPILLRQTRDGRAVRLYLGMEPAEAMTAMRLLAKHIGYHNMAVTVIYRHFNSPKEQEFIETYNAEFQLSAAGTGYFDDEQVSFAHTVANLNNNCPMLIPRQPRGQLPPAFIVGNGPSLDNFIDYIRENQDGAIVFSCGTAISSLKKVGLKADFHVEMERNIFVKDWLEQGTSAEDRSGITLLALNTLSPEVAALFDDVRLAKKPNDIGESIIDDAFQQFVPTLANCNPTVTNAALAYALYMGFEEIYLLGVDLGMREDGAHHSKLSQYAALEEKTQSGGHSAFDNKKIQYPVKGNFCDTVMTHSFLDHTRTNMVFSISTFKAKNPEITVVNPNDGAYILGATPTHKEKLKSHEPLLDKRQCLDWLKADNFQAPRQEAMSESDVRNRYLMEFFELRPKIMLSSKITNIETLTRRMNEIYRLVQASKIPVTKQFLEGSIQVLFTSIMMACLFERNKYVFKQKLDIGRKIYKRFLSEAYDFMTNRALELDDTHDEKIATLDK